LPHFDVARQYDPIRRRAHRRACKARLRFGQLSGGDFDLGRGGQPGGLATLRFLGRQSAGSADRLRTAIFRIGELGLGSRLLERRLEIGHLRFQHRDIQTRQHLAALHVVAGLNINRRDASGIAFDADGHVISRGNGANDAYRRRQAAHADLGHGYRRNRDLVGDILHPQRLGQPHGE